MSKAFVKELKAFLLNRGLLYKSGNMMTDILIDEEHLSLFSKHEVSPQVINKDGSTREAEIGESIDYVLLIKDNFTGKLGYSNKRNKGILDYEEPLSSISLKGVKVSIPKEPAKSTIDSYLLRDSINKHFSLYSEVQEYVKTENLEKFLEAVNSIDLSSLQGKQCLEVNRARYTDFYLVHKFIETPEGSVYYYNTKLEDPVVGRYILKVDSEKLSFLIKEAEQKIRLQHIPRNEMVYKEITFTKGREKIKEKKLVKVGLDYHYLTSIINNVCTQAHTCVHKEFLG